MIKAISKGFFVVTTLYRLINSCIRMHAINVNNIKVKLGHEQRIHAQPGNSLFSFTNELSKFTFKSY